MSERLLHILDQQRARHLLGRASAADQRRHSRAFAAALGEAPRRAIDLGSGGGVPGLVLAVDCWPETSLLLLDASQRRCTYLEQAVADLDLGDRVGVLWARAEEAGSQPALRGAHDAVVARSFGAPAVVAECAAPLLAVGGRLVVSEPPEGPEGRWDEEGLAGLGLAVDDSERVEGAWFTRLVQERPCPESVPRRPGVAARRPRF